MLAEVLPHLRCPSCWTRLDLAGTALRCAAGHTFDIARQGYAQLTAGPLRHTGDTAAMVAARVAFLATGHYAFVAGALARAAPVGGLVVDAGAGTGYHLAAVLDARPDAVGLALDASKAAARRAARCHPRVAAAVCDTWARLPVADGAASLVLNVFAPRNGTEFRRILAPDGVLLVVTPAADHLAELVEPLGLLRVDPSKEDRTAAALPGFRRTGRDRLAATLRLGRDELRALVAMGPNAWHDAPVPAGPLDVTAAVELGRWVPSGG